ncbi:MAG: aldehyde dehydrogenase family protein [Betaproteobacteria bacterium]|nr:aldehyde dehydrogenase family protein [Betaproteobacteria bacterium]
MHNRDKLYINGQWVESAGDNLIEVMNAATEDVIGHIPEGTEEDANKAVIAARLAFDAWAATPVAERANFLDKLHAGLKARGDDIARVITAEVGMPFKLSQRIQAGSPIANMALYAKLAREYPFEEKIGNSLVVREPVGVVACITPWNYPLHQVVAKVAPALAAGNTVVLKPSEVAPFSAFILADVAHEAGLPPGVFNLVTGYGPIVGEALVRHAQVDMISFTGSTRAGKRISELAALTVKRVALELGGKSAAVLLDDADFAAAVKGTLGACFLNSGQTCTAHTRMLIPEDRYEEVRQLAIDAAKTFAPGDPMDDRTRLGPLASAAQRDRVRDYIFRGIEEGAELVTGGPEAPKGLDKGYYVQPTVFGRVDPDGTIAQEEIFGPVLSIIGYKDEDDAVRIANNTVYGLAGAVWSKDEARALGVARRMRTGQVDINGAPFNLYAPFGGYRQSGNGRELGRFGLEEFTELKAMQLKPEPAKT